MIFITLSVTLL